MHHGIKKLLLLGAGQAHLDVLASLGRHRPGNLDVTLLTPYPHQTCNGMAPGFVAGHHSEDDCHIALAPLVHAAGARWVPGRCSGIDTAARTVQVTTAAQGPAHAPAQIPYDLLSIDTGQVLDRARLETEMPGAAMHALPLRPIEAFTALWPQVMAFAQSQAVSLAVVGAEADGIELVFAAEQGIRAHGMPGARFTLITGGTEVGSTLPAGVRQRVLRQLKRRGITVLREACTGIHQGEVHLGNGARLACDVPLLAIGTHPPAWLQGCGLALSESGHVLVNACQQSASHANVFAAGDVASRADLPPQPRSSGYTLRADPPLAHNLLAAHEGQVLQPHHPPRQTLTLLSCGAGHAIASFGPLHAEGGWAWWWKNRCDQGFVMRYRRT
jgi:NADH dehydrogenase FAD-containing subunit